MKSKEKVLEKRKKIAQEISYLLKKEDDLDIKQTEWMCEVFKKKCLNENEYTHSEIKLVRDTDWHTNYDMFFYKYETLIKQIPLYYAYTAYYKDEIDQYLEKKYPLT